MSHGARNCPFLTLTGLPVSAAAASRSVCRQRKAGICRTSTHSATAAHWLALVHVGENGHVELGAQVGEDRQRRLQSDTASGAGDVVRFALSKEVL